MLVSCRLFATMATRLVPFLYPSVLSALAVIYTLPVLLPAYLPILDLPVHAQAISIINHMDDPAFGFSKYFEIRDGILPYRTVYAVGSWLTYLFSAETSIRIVLMLIAGTLVAGTALCLRAFNRSPWLVVFVFPFIFDVNATYGYLAFRSSIALGLVLMALSRRELDQPRTWRLVAIGALAAALFLTHAHGFVIVSTLIFVMILCCSPTVRRGGRLALAGLPAIGLSLTWFYPAMGLESKYNHLPLIRLMELVPHRMLNSFTGDRDEVVCVLLFCCVLMLACFARPEKAPGGLRATLSLHFPLLACVLLVAAYFAFPNSVLNRTQPIYGINYRFLLPIGLMAVLVPVGSVKKLMPIIIVIGIGLSTLFGVMTIREYRRFGDRTRTFDDIIAKIPTDRRVLNYVYSAGDPKFTVPVLLHFVSYYHAAKGGAPAVRDTFTQYAYYPLALKDPRKHLDHRYPHQIDIRLYRKMYDYVLVTDSRKVPQMPFPAGAMTLVKRTGPWQLYAFKNDKPKPP